MNIEQQGILAQPKKPGPLTAAAQMTGVASAPPAQVEQPKPATMDPFAYRGGYSPSAPKGPSNGPDSTALTPVDQGIAAPRATQGISRLGAAAQVGDAIGAVDQGADAVGKPEFKQPSGEHGVSQNTGIAAIPVGGAVRVTTMPEGSTAPMGSGFDAAGKQLGGRDISKQKLFTNVGGDGTAGMSALSANTQGIAGMPQGNPKLGTAEDNLRQIANIQALRESTPQGGIGILGDGGIEAANEEKTRRWAMEDAVRKAPESQRAALMIGAMNHDQTNQTTRRGQDMASATAATGAGITARGQDLHAKSDANRLAGNPQDNQLKSVQAQGVMAQNDSTAMIAEIQKKAAAGDAQAMATYRALTRKELPATDQPERLTLPQRRSNFEIEAARKAVSGLSPDEVKRKTANFTATGRENPDYDPTLAKAITQANRRMYGASDDWFDQRQQAQQPAGNDGDTMTRFRADSSMKGHALGNQTDMGVEVLDASGKLVGHSR